MHIRWIKKAADSMTDYSHPGVQQQNSTTTNSSTISQESNQQNGTTNNTTSQESNEQNQFIIELTTHLPKVLADKYTVLSELGRGSYGLVLKVAEKNDNSKQWAIKLIDLRENPTVGLDVNMLHELSSLKRLNHPNIVQIREVVYEEEQPTNERARQQADTSRHPKLAFVLELADFDLNDMICGWLFEPDNPQAEHTIPMRQQWAYQILCALNYLHANDILHLDLKPKNVLIKNTNVKLADFGLEQRDKDGFKMDGQSVVTYPQRAPELQCSSPTYGPPVDIWSAGVVFLDLFFQVDLFWRDAGPFDNSEANLMNNIHANIGLPSKGWYAKYRSNRAGSWCPIVDAQDKDTLQRNLPTQILSAEEQVYFRQYYGEQQYNQIWDLITRCLQLDPDRRITAADALNHPFFVQYCQQGNICQTCLAPDHYHIPDKPSYQLSSLVEQQLEQLYQNYKKQLISVNPPSVSTLAQFGEEIYNRCVNALPNSFMSQWTVWERTALESIAVVVAMKLLNYPFVVDFKTQMIRLLNESRPFDNSDMNELELFVSQVEDWDYDGPVNNNNNKNGTNSMNGLTIPRVLREWTAEQKNQMDQIRQQLATVNRDFYRISAREIPTLTDFIGNAEKRMNSDEERQTFLVPLQNQLTELQQQVAQLEQEQDQLYSQLDQLNNASNWTQNISTNASTPAP